VKLARLLVAILPAAATVSCGDSNCDPSADAIPIAIKSISAGTVSYRAVRTLAALNRELREAISEEQRLQLVAETDTSRRPPAELW